MGGDGAGSKRLAERRAQATEAPATAQLLKEADRLAETARASPKNADACLKAGDAYHEAGEKEKAMEFYRKIAEFPAGTWEKQGLADAAMKSLSNAIRTDFNSTQLHFYLGNVALEAKNYSTAMSYLKTAVNKEPQNAEYREKFMQTVREVLDLAGDVKAARESGSILCEFLRNGYPENESMKLLLADEDAMSFIMGCVASNHTWIDGEYFGVAYLEDAIERLTYEPECAKQVLAQILKATEEWGANHCILELAAKIIHDRDPNLIFEFKGLVPLFSEALKQDVPAHVSGDRFSDEYNQRLSYEVACNQIENTIAKIGETPEGRELVMPMLTGLMQSPGVNTSRAGGIISKIMRHEANREFMFRFLMERMDDKSGAMREIAAKAVAQGIKESDYALLKSMGATEAFAGLIRDLYPEVRALKGEDVLRSFWKARRISSMLDASGSISAFLTSPETIDSFHAYLEAYSKMDYKLRNGFVLAFFPAYMASHYIEKDFEPALAKLLKCKTPEAQEQWVKQELAPYLKQKLEKRRGRELAEEKAGAKGIGRISRFFKRKKKEEGLLAEIGDDWRGILAVAAIHPALKLENYLSEKAEHAQAMRIMEQLQADRNDFKDFVTGFAYAYYLRRTPVSNIGRITPKMHSKHSDISLRGTYGKAEYHANDVRISGSLFALISELGHYSALELIGESHSEMVKNKDGFGLLFAGGRMIELPDRLALSSEKTYPPEAQKAIDFAYHTYMLGLCIVKMETENAELMAQVRELEKRFGLTDRVRYPNLSPSEIYSIGRLLLGKFTPADPQTKEHADSAKLLLETLGQEHINEIIGVSMLSTENQIVSVEIQLPLPYQAVLGARGESTHRISERLSIDAAVNAVLIARQTSATVSLMPYIHEYIRTKIMTAGQFGIFDGQDFDGALRTMGMATPEDFLYWMEKSFPGHMQSGASIPLSEIASPEIRKTASQLSPSSKSDPNRLVAPRLVESAVIFLIYQKYGLEADLEKAQSALERFNPEKDQMKDIFARYETA